jgi:hypothetical protein
MMDSPHANDPSGAPVPGSNPTAATANPSENGKADLRDVVAELSERAQTISRDASGRIASAMRDVIGTSAGLAGFAVESARDLVQFMVRRGQMTAAEGDRLMREADAAQRKRSPARTAARPSGKEPSVPAKPAAKVAAKASANVASKASPKPPARTGTKAAAKTTAKQEARATPSSAKPAAKPKLAAKSATAKKKK